MYGAGGGEYGRRQGAHEARDMTLYLTTYISKILTKGGVTLALPGWKQNDVLLTVDWHDPKEAGSRNVVYYRTILF